MSFCKQNSSHPNTRSRELLPPLPWLLPKGTTCLQGARLQRLPFLPLIQPSQGLSPVVLLAFRQFGKPQQ